MCYHLLNIYFTGSSALPGALAPSGLQDVFYFQSCHTTMHICPNQIHDPQKNTMWWYSPEPHIPIQPQREDGTYQYFLLH